MRAAFMPPWGLMDEPQHLHYVRELADSGRAPVAGADLLPQDLVDNMFAERRWELFRWDLPERRDAAGIGLSGHSYEGYHPPLYYALLAPIHWLWSGSLAGELYALRLVTVLLSLVSLALVYAAAREAFPQRRTVALLAVALLACSPERMHATSRLNNDALLETWGALTLWLCVVVIQRGLTFGRTASIGAAFCGGVLTKASMLAFAPLPLAAIALRRSDPGVLAKSLVMAAVVGVGLAPWVAHNLSTYGDWSGFNGFVAAVGAPIARDVGLAGFAKVVYDSATKPWIYWQRGMFEMHNALTVGVYLALLATFATAAFGLGRELLARGALHAKRRRVEFALLLSAGCGVAAIGWTYAQGKVPEINGRFLLPFTLPATLLIARGWSLTRAGRTIALPFVVAMFVLAGALLFASDLQYFYFPRDLEAGFVAKTQQYVAALRAGRPAFLAPWQILAPLGYAACVVWFVVQLRRRRSARR